MILVFAAAFLDFALHRKAPYRPSSMRGILRLEKIEKSSCRLDVGIMGRNWNSLLGSRFVKWQDTGTT
jgi:hypothetical protein